MPSHVWGRVCHSQPALPDQEQPGMRWRLRRRLPSDSRRAACRLEVNTSCTCLWGYICGALPPVPPPTVPMQLNSLKPSGWNWWRIPSQPCLTGSCGGTPVQGVPVWHLSLCRPSVCQVQAPVLLLERHKMWRSWCSWQGKCVLTEKPA